MSHDPQLSPLRTWDLFGRAIALYWRSLPLVTVIVAVPLIPLTIAHLLLLTAPGLQQILSFAQNSVVVLLLDAVLITAASQVYTHQRATLQSIFQHLRQRLGVVLATLLIQGLFLLIPSRILLSMLQQPTATTSDALRISLLALLLSIPLLVGIVRFYLVTAIAILEWYDLRGTLQQSWRLTSRAGGQIILVVFASGLFGLLITSLPKAVLSIILNNRTSMLAQWSYAISVTLLTQLSLLVVWPIQSILTTVLYHNLRVRASQTSGTSSLPNDATG